MENTIYAILEEITGTDEVRNNPDIELFTEGLLDSLMTVQLIVEIESQLGVVVPISDVDREDWATPNKIILEVQRLQTL